jgi:hypothetical protein
MFVPPHADFSLPDVHFLRPTPKNTPRYKRLSGDDDGDYVRYNLEKLADVAPETTDNKVKQEFGFAHDSHEADKLIRDLEKLRELVILKKVIHFMIKEKKKIVRNSLKPLRQAKREANLDQLQKTVNGRNAKKKIHKRTPNVVNVKKGDQNASSDGLGPLYSLESDVKNEELVEMKLLQPHMNRKEEPTTAHSPVNLEELVQKRMKRKQKLAGIYHQLAGIAKKFLGETPNVSRKKESEEVARRTEQETGEQTLPICTQPHD